MAIAYCNALLLLLLRNVVPKVYLNRMFKCSVTL